jgi:uncharacterized circularly permuted ATP-grasp superfamily protein/uncharacterized alpha-E superfamily protein
MTETYDEMVSGKGVLRPHWRQTMAAIWGMSPEILQEKQARAAAHLAEVDRLLISEDQTGGNPPDWSIDLLPLILPESEWKIIAAGLTQRAQLLDLILADIYGPQSLIAEGALPPYLIFNNPGFLRPLRHVAPVGAAPRLHFYAADLVRTPDGKWCVLADRTQAPAGVGYALHHRSILARTFPEGFRNAPVRRLQSTIELWHGSLRSIGATISGEPRIVLLTPGPHSGAYLEHVLLAQELGIVLVQGSDLTVRQNHVYLKTLDGLEQVDVIYRRLDGEYCDPLELRSDSALGVAGMIGAMRAGNVIVLNVPGSAVLETPAFAPFLPNLALRLLGTELTLPAATTWWCGQREPLAQVLQSFDRFHLRPTFDPDTAPIDPSRLSEAERANLLNRLQIAPEQYVAIEPVSPSLVPNLGTTGLEPRPVVLRACVIWNEGTWVAVPGGVARATGGGEVSRGGLKYRASVKDVWVMSDEPDAPAQSIAVPAAADTRQLKRATDVLGSRAADDLFWLGRYVERLDFGARLFRAALGRLADSNLGPRDLAEIDLLVAALSRSGWISESVANLPAESQMFPAGIVGAVADRPFVDCQNALRRLGLAQRDRLSKDMWRTIGYLGGHVASKPSAWTDRPPVDRSPADAGDADKLLPRLDGIVTNAATFGGLVAENMTRTAGWRFLEIGRRIERGISVCNIVGSLISSRSTWVELSVRLVFELCDSIITHRKRYLTDSYSLPMLDLVVSDRTNPRGLIYQLASLQAHLDMLVGQDPLADEKQMIDGMVAAVLQALADGISSESLVTLTGTMRGDLMTLSEKIAQKFFTHVDPARSFVFGARNAQRAIAS